MALNLNERYPGRFNNPSPDYPQGSFKNRTTPAAKDGSYLEKDWANDKEGFFQSLLSTAAVAANNVVDKVGASQYFDALVKVIKATSIPWANVTNRPTTVSGYGITDAMPVAGGPYRTTLNGVAVKLNGGFDLGQPGGYITYGDGDGGLASAMTFVANGGGSGAQAFGGFTWRVVSLNNTNTGPAMTYTYNGRLTVPTEISVPKIISNTEAPTQAVGYAGQYISNCAFVAASINAIPKDTALLTANGWSKNGTTGEIIQYVDVVVGDAAGTVVIPVSWPFNFPTACLSVKISFRVANGSPIGLIPAFYALTTSGTNVKLEEINAPIQSGLVLMIEARGN